MITPTLMTGVAFFLISCCFGLLWSWLQGRAKRRSIVRVESTGEQFAGKVLRHSPTGRVGRVIGIQYKPHRAFRYLRPTIYALIAPNDACVMICAIHPPAAIMMVEQGRIWAVPVSELAAALPQEVEAYQ